MKTKTVCVVGGGPAGMICGLLLAQKGHNVTVLERNPDFDREFRGEVLQPRFMEAVNGAGLMPIIENIPSERFQDLKLFSRGKLLGRFTAQALNQRFPYITWMTQPNLLQGLKEAADSYDNFNIIFSAKVNNLIWDGDRCKGLTYRTGDEVREIMSDVVVGADGRFSSLRSLGNFEMSFHSHRFDVLWFHTKRPEGFDHGVDFFVDPDFACLTLPKYPDLIQCGILAETNRGRQLIKDGVEEVAGRLIKAHPMFSAFAEQLKSESDFTVLQAKIERVKKWAKNGVVLIGDAAHTCSPLFAIGVTIATETAITAARVIDEAPDCSENSLSLIQRERQGPVLKLHRRQEFGARFGILNPAMRYLIPWVAPLALRSGIPERFIGSVLGRQG